MLLSSIGFKGAVTKLKSMLKIKRRDALLLAIFYAAAGVAQIAVLAMSDFAIFTSGILAVLNFIAAYGLFTVKRWSIWLAIGLFFPQFVFGAASLYASILWYMAYQEAGSLWLNIALMVYMGLLLVSFVYIAAKRNSFMQT